MSKEYTIYHIPGKKIGVTNDLYNRVERQQGYEVGEYEILESSEDMVNWNSANPGTYGASTNERFFRIRAVQDTE